MFASARAPFAPFAFLALFVASDVTAAALSWRTATSGNAGIAGNWLPSQVPAPADVLTFQVGGGYTVTFDATADSATSHFYRSGSVTVVNSGGHTLSGQIRVGDAAGDIGTLVFTTGPLTGAGTVVIAHAGGSTGTLNVDDDDADLLQSGVAADVLVGNGGTGTLQVLGGGLVDAADKVIVAGTSASQGTVLVSGVNAVPLVRSSLATSGADGDLVFGSGGTATGTIGAGGQANVADDLILAVTASSNANVTVTGSSGGFASSISVADDLVLAHNTLAGTAAGTGTLVVQDGATVTVGGSTFLGETDGGTGTLRVRPSSTFTTTDLLCDDAHGVLDHAGGSIVISGGQFVPADDRHIVDDVGSETLRLTGAATASFDGGTSTGYSLIVGELNQGFLDIEGGSDLTQVNGVLAIGLGAASDGLVDLDGGSQILGAGTIVVGLGGTGRLDVGTTADVAIPEMSLAYLPGSEGQLVVAGSGSSVTVGTMTIAGQGGSNGGTALVAVEAGASLVVNGGGTVPLRIRPGGTLSVGTGSTVNAANNFDSFGAVVLEGGTITTGSLNLQSNGSLAGRGTVQGDVAAGSATALVHATGGTLTLGSAGSIKGFDCAGTLRVASGATVTLFDSDGSGLGNVEFAGGTITLPSAGGTVQATRRLTGSGTVNGALTVAGEIAPGSSDGLVAVTGSLTLAGGGGLEMEIGDAPTLRFDRIQVSGQATLTGGVLDVRILPGFVPDDGEVFTVLTCGGRIGQFAAVTIEGLPVNGQFNVNYGPTNVSIQVNHITTDVPPIDVLPRELAFSSLATPGPDAAFALALPEAAFVSVRLFGPDGRALGTLHHGESGPGVVRWRLREVAPHLPAGVYFARAHVRTRTSQLIEKTARLTLVR